MAGAIWHALNTHGELSLDSSKLVEGKGPVFDWAIGWLMREARAVIIPRKRADTESQSTLRL